MAAPPRPTPPNPPPKPPKPTDPFDDTPSTAIILPTPGASSNIIMTSTIPGPKTSATPSLGTTIQLETTSQTETNTQTETNSQTETSFQTETTSQTGTTSQMKTNTYTETTYNTSRTETISVTAGTSVPPATTKNRNLGIIGGVAAAILLLCATCIGLFIFLRRRRRQKGGKKRTFSPFVGRNPGRTMQRASTRSGKANDNIEIPPPLAPTRPLGRKRHVFFQLGSVARRGDRQAERNTSTAAELERQNEILRLEIEELRLLDVTPPAYSSHG